MTYVAPPTVARIAPVLVVAATNTTLVAAPAAGFRIRVVGGHWGVNRAATGVTDLALTDGAAGAVLAQGPGLSVAGTPFVPILIPEPGIVLTVATALVVNEASSIAAGNYVAVVYYYVDEFI